MNPLTGQGGNSAIEDAAMLGDLLKEALDRSPQPPNELIRAQFTQFQEERRYRTKLLADGAHSLQRLEALENPVLEFVALKIASKQGLDKVAPMFATMYSPGHILKYLPRLSQEGVVARDSDVIAKPRQRSYSSTAVWTILTLIVACFSVNTGQSPSTEGTAAVSDPMSDYTFVCMMAINGLWMVESHRPGLSGGLLCRSVSHWLPVQEEMLTIQFHSIHSRVCNHRVACGRTNLLCYIHLPQPTTLLLLSQPASDRPARCRMSSPGILDDILRAHSVDPEASYHCCPQFDLSCRPFRSPNFCLNRTEDFHKSATQR